MIALSLLPPEKKERIRQEQLYRQRLFMLLAIGAGIGMMVSSVVTVHVLLDRSLHRINAQIQQEDAAAGRPSSSALVQKIQLYQGALAKLTLPAESRTSLIAEMTKAVPTGVTLSALQLSLDDLSATLKGSATDRPSFLAFQQALQALPFIQDLETPISALAKKGDLTFSLQIHLKMN